MFLDSYYLHCLLLDAETLEYVCWNLKAQLNKTNLYYIARQSKEYPYNSDKSYFLHTQSIYYVVAVYSKGNVHILRSIELGWGGREILRNVTSGEGQVTVPTQLCNIYDFRKLVLIRWFENFKYFIAISNQRNRPT